MAVLLLGVVATVWVWTSGYWYLWNHWILPLAFGRSEPCCATSVDARAVAGAFAIAYAGLVGLTTAGVLALTLRWRWSLLWLGLTVLTLALMYAAAFGQDVSVILLLADWSVCAFVIGAGLGSWLGQRARRRLQIAGV
jgi:hypothetical protein